MSSQLLWPEKADDWLYDQLTVLIQAVAAAQGAVGWLSVPPPEECRAWVDARLREGSRWVVLTDGDQVVATARWAYETLPVWSRNGHVSQVMTHPERRGAGHGRRIMTALMEDARSAGVESLVLDVRGNNHGAMRMYESLGFVECGVRTDFVAVGDERFDLVMFQLALGYAPGLIRHGRRQEGPGAS